MSALRSGRCGAQLQVRGGCRAVHARTEAVGGLGPALGCRPLLWQQPSPDGRIWLDSGRGSSAQAVDRWHGRQLHLDVAMELPCAAVHPGLVCRHRPPPHGWRAVRTWSAEALRCKLSDCMAVRALTAPCLRAAKRAAVRACLAQWPLPYLAMASTQQLRAARLGWHTRHDPLPHNAVARSGRPHSHTDVTWQWYCTPKPLKVSCGY